YAGQPAVTVNAFGKGKAYFVGTRLDARASAEFYGKVVASLALEPVIDATLPAGVTAQLRGAGDDVFVFLLTFSKASQVVQLGSRVLQDVETGESSRRQLTLQPLAAKVYRIGK